ncbi:MAG TPA: hypothetical protein PL033_21020 [Candidatus Brocadiia bacterium]|nr:hypothetical protein [Candidatus Brocadiia bacterium]
MRTTARLNHSRASQLIGSELDGLIAEARAEERLKSPELRRDDFELPEFKAWIARHICSYPELVIQALIDKDRERRRRIDGELRHTATGDAIHCEYYDGSKTCRECTTGGLEGDVLIYAEKVRCIAQEILRQFPDMPPVPNLAASACLRDKIEERQRFVQWIEKITAVLKRVPEELVNLDSEEKRYLDAIGTGELTAEEMHSRAFVARRGDSRSLNSSRRTKIATLVRHGFLVKGSLGYRIHAKYVRYWPLDIRNTDHT